MDRDPLALVVGNLHLGAALLGRVRPGSTAVQVPQMNDLRILDALVRPTTPRELGLSQGTVSKWLNVLAAEGYVRRVGTLPGTRRPHQVWERVPLGEPGPVMGYRDDPLLGAMFR